MNVLTNSDSRRFHEDGFLVLPGLFRRNEINTYCAELSRLAGLARDDGSLPVPGASVLFEPGFDPHGRDALGRELGVRKFFQFAQGDSGFWATARDPRLVAILDALLGPGARLLQSMALVKPPGIGSPKDWHQDLPYFLLDPPDSCVGIWVALDPATRDNGCMEMVPGSHRQGVVEHVQGPTGWRLPDTAAARAQAAAVALPVDPGSAIVFHAGVLHFTGPNRTATRRRAFQYHYVPATTKVGPPAVAHPLIGVRPPLAA
jgi:phytanoyl-CoA hydroxylase